METNPPPLQSEGPSDDWLNVFEDHASKASSEGLQDLFSKVLAGEIRKPGSFSLATMHFVSVMDARIAALIEAVAPFVLNGNAIPQESLPANITVPKVVELEDAGFLAGSGGTLGITLTPTSSNETYLKHGEKLFRATEVKRQYRLTVYTLTRSGKELLSALAIPTNDIAIGQALWAANPASVWMMKIQPGDTLGVMKVVPKPVANK